MSATITAKIGREVDHLRDLALRMGGLSESILAKSLRAVWNRDAGLASEVVDDDVEIDRIDVEIDARSDVDELGKGTIEGLGPRRNAQKSDQREEAPLREGIQGVSP